LLPAGKCEYEAQAARNMTLEPKDIGDTLLVQSATDSNTIFVSLRYDVRHEIMSAITQSSLPIVT